MVPTPARIKPLPPATSALIAAGEIIHSPQDVLKELLENALDAASTSIVIEMSQGGLERLIVRDNGHGILAEDLSQAPLRYTTSKLQHVDELRGLLTYGFRGEALFSISAVSNFTLRSRPATQEQGHQIRLWSPQREWEEQDCAMNVGTEVYCEHLFAPMPVRRQFLKSARLESRRCVQTAMNVLLMHPHCQVRCLDQGSTQIHWPVAQNLLQRLTRAFQLPEQAWEIFEHECDRGVIKIWYCPDHTRGLEQYWYCHQRWFSDKALTRLAQQFFEQGMLIIDLAIGRDAIDVNYHPQKHEIDFVRKEGLMASLTDIFQATARQKERVLASSSRSIKAQSLAPQSQYTSTPQVREFLADQQGTQRQARANPLINLRRPEPTPPRAVVAHQPMKKSPTPVVEESGWVFLGKNHALYQGTERLLMIDPEKLGSSLCARQSQVALLLPIKLTEASEAFLSNWPCRLGHLQIEAAPKAWDRFWLVALFADFESQPWWYRRFYQGQSPLWGQLNDEQAVLNAAKESDSFIRDLPYEDCCERLAP